jgi:YfiH family protein
MSLNPQTIVQMEQVHKTIVKRINKSDRGKMIKNADGLITSDPEIVLMLRIADCVPVFLFDSKNQAIGLVHSGWRGTVGKIILFAIEKMMVEFGSDPKDLLMALGPSIQPCCNILKNPLQLELPEWKPFLNKKDKGFAVDLPEFIIDTAIQAGMKKENIKTTTICTVMKDNLYSYKRSKETGEKEGRFAAIISLKS